MILEVIVSTLNEKGEVNLAPMGISWEDERLLMRPYRDSATFRNLTLNGQGVVNFTDSVLVFAHCAVGEKPFSTFPARSVRGAVLSDTCHWREFEVETAERGGDRARFLCRCVGEGRVRDFVGLNRAKHAVIEAAIAASRIPWLGAEEVGRQVENLTPLIDKTAGPQEREAFAFLTEYVRKHLSGKTGSGAAGVK
ncbi:MAG: DUF447 domain-containing protein [Acidobacteriota bacterium]|nr:DUF447 family protein [Acidobacteriota bacterium]